MVCSVAGETLLSLCSTVAAGTWLLETLGSALAVGCGRVGVNTISFEGARVGLGAFDPDRAIVGLGLGEGGGLRGRSRENRAAMETITANTPRGKPTIVAICEYLANDPSSIQPSL